MSKDDLPTLLLAAFVAFGLTFFIANALFGSPKFGSDSVQIADPLPSRIEPIDQRVQKGINPTELIKIGPTDRNPGF